MFTHVCSLHYCIEGHLGKKGWRAQKENRLVGRAHRELHSTQIMEPLCHGNSWRLGQRNGEQHPVTGPGVWPQSENGSAGLDPSQHYKLSLCLPHKGDMAQKRLVTCRKGNISLWCPALLRAAGCEHLHCVPYATPAFHVVHSRPVLPIEILQLLLAQPRDLHLGTDTQRVS